MKKYFSLAGVLLLLFVSLGTAQASHKSKKGTLLDALTKRETALWEAWKSQKTGPFNDALSADTVMVSDSGVAGKAESIKALASGDCKVESYSLSDFKVTMFTKDMALLTYKAEQHVTCGGTAAPVNIVASSMWIRRGGKWYAAFHQETPAAGQ